MDPRYTDDGHGYWHCNACGRVDKNSDDKRKMAFRTHLKKCYPNLQQPQHEPATPPALPTIPESRRVHVVEEIVFPERVTVTPLAGPPGIPAVILGLQARTFAAESPVAGPSGLQAVAAHPESRAGPSGLQFPKERKRRRAVCTATIVRPPDEKIAPIPELSLPSELQAPARSMRRREGAVWRTASNVRPADEKTAPVPELRLAPAPQLPFDAQIPRDPRRMIELNEFNELNPEQPIAPLPLPPIVAPMQRPPPTIIQLNEFNEFIYFNN